MAQISMEILLGLFYGLKGHREICQVVLCFKGPWRNILGCFVAKRATEKFIMLGEIFDVVLRPKGPRRNF